MMCVDRFVLPRLTGVVRALEPMPTWRAAALANWPALLAVLVGVGFGAWWLGLVPGQDEAPSWGLVPVEAWLLAGLVYAGLAAVAARSPAGAWMLGLRPAERNVRP